MPRAAPPANRDTTRVSKAATRPDPDFGRAAIHSRTPSAIAPATAPVLPNMVSNTTATSMALTSKPSRHPPRRHGQVPAAPEHGPLALLTSPVVGGLVALRGPVLVDKP